jgi:hypothetical protein
MRYLPKLSIERIELMALGISKHTLEKAKSMSNARSRGSFFAPDAQATRRRDRAFRERTFKNRGRVAPGLEPLEDRMLLTTYSVNSTADTNTGSGDSGTLRYAIT